MCMSSLLFISAIGVKNVPPLPLARLFLELFAIVFLDKQQPGYLTKQAGSYPSPACK